MRRAGLLLLCAQIAPGPAAAISLDELLAGVLDRHETAAASAQALAASEARVARARAFFFPTLTARAGYTRRAFENERTIDGRTVTLQGQNSLLATGSLSLVLFDARSFPLYRRARLEAEAQAQSSLETRRLLLFEAADAFLRTLGLERELDAARHRRAYAQEALVDARARLAVALVGTNEVTRPELDVVLAERELVERTAAVERAYLELSFLAGVDVAPPLVGVEALVRVEAETSTRGASERASRPDLRARRLRQAAAEQLAAEPMLRLVPSLSLAGEVRATNDSGLSGRDVDGSLSINLSWTLFDGGQRYAERDELSALAEVARLEAALSERGADLEVARALVELRARRESRAAARRALHFAERNAVEVQELYRQGLARVLEVSDANLRRFEAEVALAREEYSLLLAFLDLRAARGLDPLGKELAP